MNQYQQSPYQQPVYPQQHFGKSYGGFQGQQSGAPTANGSQKTANQTNVQTAGYQGYNTQQFYPSGGYEEHDYSKSYGQQAFFGGQAKQEYKAHQVS